MPAPDQVYRVRDFLGGRNSTTSEPLVKANETVGDLNAYYRPIGSLTKRPGWARFSTDSFGTGVVRGLHAHYGSTGERFLYVYTPTNLTVEDINGIRTTLKNDYTENTFMTFASAKDRVYSTNFNELPHRSNGTIAGTTTAFLEPPQVPFKTLSDFGTYHGTTSGVGTYSYRFKAYYGSELGESGFMRVSGLANRASVTTQYRELTIWFVATAKGYNFPTTNPIILPLSTVSAWPAGMESLRIYRSQNFTFDEDDPSSVPTSSDLIQQSFFLLDDIKFADLNKNYEDVTKDARLGVIAEFDPLDTPHARFVTQHANRLFYAHANPRWLEAMSKSDVETNNLGFWEDKKDHLHWLRVGPVESSRVYWTQTDVPDNIEGFQDVYPQDGDVITGIMPVGDNLIIFKRRHIYRMSGFHPEDLRINLIASTIGNVAPRSLAYLPNQEAAIWLAHDGVYTYDGAGIQRVSDKIRADILAIRPEDIGMAVGTVHDNMYFLSLAEV